MSPTVGGPFPVDPVLGARRSALHARHGDAFAAALRELQAGPAADARHPAAVIPAAVVPGLLATFGLAGVEELMVLALEPARTLARPPISGYHVGAVALCSDSGDLLLGGNLEFPGAAIWQTIHGEGFVTVLARARGERIGTLLITQARPCAHCRQVLAEAAGSADLRLIDPVGHELELRDIYPWPFAPEDLGMEGALPDRRSFTGLQVTGDIPAPVAALLEAEGARTHAPYSHVPAAVVLRLAGGALVGGSVLESVAFNPTVGPAQDALVGVLAAGRDWPEIEEAWLAVQAGAAVNHETTTRDALAAAAPGAPLHVTYWA